MTEKQEFDQLMNNKERSIFGEELSDDEKIEELEEVKNNIDKPPSKLNQFWNTNRGWIIVIAVMLLVIIALALTVYFINIKCKATVDQEREKYSSAIDDMNSKIATTEENRNRYCTEAQELRSKLRETMENFEKFRAQTIQERKQQKPVSRINSRKQNPDGVFNIKSKSGKHKHKVEEISESDNDEPVINLSNDVDVNRELPTVSHQLNQKNNKETLEYHPLSELNQHSEQISDDDNIDTQVNTNDNGLNEIVTQDEEISDGLIEM